MDEKKIKVTDKRMFTPEGELREEYREALEDRVEEPTEANRPAPPAENAETEPAAEPEETAAEVSAPDSQESAIPDGGESGRVEMPDLGPAAHKPQFADLVAVLAQPIAMYLGDMPLPDGKSAENLDAARLYIDMLEVLRTKTMGNLSAQELTLLDDLLYQTRLRYVQKRG